MGPRFLAAAAAACSLLLAAGCGAPSLEGVWEGGATGTSTITFAGSKATMATSIMSASITVTADMAYSHDSGRLKLTNVAIDAPSVPQVILEQARSRAPKELEATVAWKNADEIVIQFPENPIVPAGNFKRKKQ